jgi:hypothetical protein
MNILRSGHSLGHQLTDSIEPARGRRYPPGAVRFRSKPARALGDMGPVMRAERKSSVSIPANRQKPAMDLARGGPAGVVTLIFCVGLALEATLPWAMIWLSDLFVFDTPAWSRWVVFGGPAVLSVLALMLYEVLGAGSRQLSPASVTARQRR